MFTDSLKKAAVRHVKPRVPPATWKRLRAPAAAAQDSVAVARTQVRQRRASLTDLAKEFGTDKWGAHFYTPHYATHLGRFRGDHFTLLELGIGGYSRAGQGGASLRMWRAYFRHANIIGLDIQDKSFVDQDRIRSYRGSQVDADLLHKIVEDAGSIRVIIDDGSHRPEHIRESFRILFPLLEDGGVYVIEDVQTSYWPRWGGSVDRHDPTTTMALVKDLIDGLNYEEFLDDHEPTYSDRHVVAVHAYHNLVFIEKGENAEGSNRSPKETQWVAEHSTAGG